MASLRRRHNDFVEDAFAEGAALAFMAIWLILSGIVLGVMAMVHGINLSSHNDAAEVRVQMVETFNDNSDASERKRLARSILKLEKQGLDTMLNNASDGDDNQKDVTNALKSVASDGRLLELDTSKMDWHGFWQWRLRYMLPFVVLAMFAIWFLTYAYYRIFVCEEYLMDLPWRHVWPFLFVLITAVPIGWPFYAVSAVRTHLARKRHEEIEREAAEAHERHLAGDREWHTQNARIQDPPRPEETPQSKRKVKFNHEPFSAQQTYFQMRNGGWRDYLLRKQSELENRKQEIEDDLQDFGQQVRELQQDRSHVVAELRDLQRKEVPDEPLTPEELEAEFAQLQQLHGVKAVRVVNDQLSLLVEARITYGGEIYDLGDWDLRIGGGFHAYELRSGARREWGERYPVYRLGSGNFCFGSRDYVIIDNLNKGQLLEATELAVNCLHSVNQEDLHNIPRAFFKEDE